MKRVSGGITNDLYLLTLRPKDEDDDDDDDNGDDEDDNNGDDKDEGDDKDDGARTTTTTTTTTKTRTTVLCGRLPPPPPPPVPSPSSSSSSSSSTSSSSSSSSSTYSGEGVIVRLFGAPTLIARDVESPLYASLSSASLCCVYYGRFGGVESLDEAKAGVSGGRVEAFLRGYRALTPEDLKDRDTSLAIAEQCARVHGFVVPSHLSDVHVPGESGLFKTLSAWLGNIRQALKDGEPDDGRRARVGAPYGKVPASRCDEVKTIDLECVERIVTWVEELTDGERRKGTQEAQSSGSAVVVVSAVPPAGKSSGGGSCPPPFSVVFCHNDLLAANIMVRSDPPPLAGELPTIQLIDFEYGGMNFAAFDIANHFNEFAGGTDDANPLYSRFPDVTSRERFVRRYVEVRGFTDVDKAVEQLMDEVDLFVIVNHFFWGSWAVNQAANEGLDTFDYLLYGLRRFSEGLKHWKSREQDEINNA